MKKGCVDDPVIYFLGSEVGNGIIHLLLIWCLTGIVYIVSRLY